MPETIGQQLKAAREARNLTFEKVTQMTRIRGRLLKALEEDDFEALPSPVQARAFLKIYADYLGLSLDEMIAHQRTSVEVSAEAETAVEASPESPSNEPEKPEPLIQTEQTVDPIPETSIDKNEEPEPEESEQPAPVTRAKHNPADRLAAFFTRLRDRVKRPQPESGSDLSEDSAATSVTEAESPSSFEPEVHPDPVVQTALENENPDQIETNVSPEAVPVFETASVPAENAPPESTPPEGSHGATSHEIFLSIGQALRHQREMLSLTPEEIENNIHVRIHYLKDMEAGNFGNLPSSVQARGMLNNYGGFLDMDVDALLLKFADGLQAQRLERQPLELRSAPQEKTVQSSPRARNPRLRRYLSMDSLVGVGLVVVLLLFAVWGTSRIMGIRSAITPLPTAQSISNVLEVSPTSGTFVPTDTLETAQASQAPDIAAATDIGTLPSAGDGPIQLVVVAKNQAYLRVTVDGVKQFDGRVTAGSAYPFSGKNQIEVLTGDGSALSVIFNQSDLGPLGNFGQVVDRIYTVDAILEPTATNTPTPTITLTPTVTPRFSPTPSRTPTITPTLPGQP